jgi:hypothetical protein
MNIKRMRGRNNRSGSSGGGFRTQQSGTPLNRNHVFDSNGPEQRIRGTAQQLQEKYQQMGRDATTSGDRVMAESYFQFAEHYFRIIAAMNQAQSHHAGQSSGQYNGQTSNQSSGQNHQNGQSSFQNNANGNGSAGVNGRRDEGSETMQDGDEPAGLGDQPVMESREIPIASAPPEG